MSSFRDVKGIFFGWIYLSFGHFPLAETLLCGRSMTEWMNECVYPSGFLPPLPSAWHLNLATAYFSITLGCWRAEICRPYNWAETLGGEGLVSFLTIIVNPLLLYHLKAKWVNYELLKEFTNVFFLWGSWPHISVCHLLRATLHQLLQMP